MLWDIKPRRRKLVGKQKKLYEDSNISISEAKIDLLKNKEFLNNFKAKKVKEKKNRLILIGVLVFMGIVTISMLI